MNNESDKHTEPLVNLKTEKDQVTVNAPEYPLRKISDIDSGEPITISETPKVADGEASDTEKSLITDSAENGDQTNKATKSKKRSKAQKKEMETLEQFIKYAYGRKGKPLKLEAPKKITKNSRLDDIEVIRLLEVAKSDLLLAVPRQLLLLSHDLDGVINLRKALKLYVSSVMLNHSIFQDPGVQAAIRNQPEALSPAGAFAKIMTTKLESISDSIFLKDDDQATLLNNAIQLFATWLAVDRGLKTSEISSLLLQEVWLPSAQKLQDESARLRALTNLSQVESVGLACQRLQQQAVDAKTQQLHLQTEASYLRKNLADIESILTQAQEQRDSLQAELSKLKLSSSTELESLRQQYAVGKTHLQHDLEQLRGRITRRLTDSIDMLEVGLSAMRREPPRVPVMVERAELVVDYLRAEIRELED